MTSQIPPLKFLSPVIPLAVTSDAVPFEDVLDDWRVTETLSARLHTIDGRQYREYRVLMERRPKLREDRGSLYIHGCYLARAIDRAWAYATGRLPGLRGYELFISPLDPPKEWETNAENVVPEDDWRILRLRVSAEPRHLRVSALPLRRTVRILKGIVDATDVLQQLCTYHYTALVTTDEELHLLLFAQALEIVRELLPGASTTEKEGRLPQAVRDRLRHRLNRLFELCQQRRQTRHAIDKKQGVSIKPDIGYDEADAFQQDANLLINWVVTHDLGVPLAVANDGVSDDIA